MFADVLYVSIYVSQQLGVMLGVGAQSVLLCAHLVRIHRGEFDDEQASFARAARAALGIGLFLMVLSGAAAVAVHVLQGRYDILFAPAFVMKWLLMAALAAVYLVQARLHAWSNVLAWLAGGSWYALFLVHSLAPVAGWASLGMLYCAWMLFFGALWGVFVLLMRKRGALSAAPQRARQAPAAAAAPPLSRQEPVPQRAPEMPKPAPIAQTIVEAVLPNVPWWKRLLLWAARQRHAPEAPASAPVAVVAPAQPAAVPAAAAPVAPLPQKPTVAASAPPVPPAPKLPSASPPPQPPKPVPLAVTAKQPPPVPPAAPAQAAEPYNPDVPALRIMPQRPEDVARAVRPPVVKPTVPVATSGRI